MTHSGLTLTLASLIGLAFWARSCWRLYKTNSPRGYRARASWRRGA